MFYTLTALWKLKRSLQQGSGYKEFFQAGKSVDGIHAIEPAAVIVRRFAAAAELQTAKSA